MSYPVTLHLGGKKVLVVGGGNVATRKVKGVFESGAHIELVAPNVTSELSNLAMSGVFHWHRRNFKETDLKGAWLVFAATNKPEVNREVWEAATKAGVFCNIADDPSGGDFIVPALWRDGDVTVTVDSSGQAPVLSAWLRDFIGPKLPEGTAMAAELLGRMRRGVEDSKSRVEWYGMLDDGLVHDLGRGDFEAASKKVDALFGKGTWARFANGIGTGK